MTPSGYPDRQSPLIANQVTAFLAAATAPAPSLLLSGWPKKISREHLGVEDYCWFPFTDLQRVHVAFYIPAKPYEGYPGSDDLELELRVEFLNLSFDLRQERERLLADFKRILALSGSITPAMS